MKGTILISVVLVHAVAFGGIRVDFYEKDGVTPYDGRPLMVGSELSIKVSSDVANYWGGGLFIAGDDRGRGCLSARGLDLESRDWVESHLPAAGEYARVTSWKDQYIWGYDLYTSDANGLAGDWFVIDYLATGVGDPNVQLYDYSVSYSEPVEVITFAQGPSRDMNNDGIVNAIDFATFAAYWLISDCNEPNGCGRADFNRDGNIDVYDLALFGDYWMWGVPVQTVEPDITFSIADAGGAREIILPVGQSITLYIDKVSHGADLRVFNLEVNISDPNLGSIDNTPYDPNDPPGPGTARILAEPRDSFFDNWGPGGIQEAGIQVVGVCISSAINDGHLASFVYTSAGAGEVRLELHNHMKDYRDRREPIIIRQSGVAQVEDVAHIEVAQQDATSTSGEVDIAEIVASLENMWRSDEELRKAIGESEWQQFMAKVQESDVVAQ